MSSQMLLIILPLGVIELGLLAFALNDLIKRKKVKGGLTDGPNVITSWVRKDHQGHSS